MIWPKGWGLGLNQRWIRTYFSFVVKQSLSLVSHLNDFLTALCALAAQLARIIQFESAGMAEVVIRGVLGCTYFFFARIRD